MVNDKEKSFTIEDKQSISDRIFNDHNHFSAVTGYGPDSYNIEKNVKSSPFFMLTENDKYFIGTQESIFQIVELDEAVYASLSGYYYKDKNIFTFGYYKLEFQRNSVFLNHIFQKHDIQDFIPKIDELDLFIRKYNSNFEKFAIQLSFDKHHKLDEIKLYMYFNREVDYYTKSITLLCNYREGFIKNKDDSLLFAKMSFLGIIFDNLDDILGYKDWIDMFENYKRDPENFENVIELIHY